jgi:polar amino acid transport system substrate-binding protein
MLSSAFKTPERETFLAYFHDPYLRSLPIGFYTWSGSGIEVQKYEDLAKARSIGVLNDASYFDRFDRDKGLPKVKVPSQDQLFPMLVGRRIDLIAGYVDTEDYRLVVEGYRGRVTRMAYTVDAPVEVYMALSRASPLAARLSEFDAVNKSLLEEGLIQKMIESYKHRYQ